MVIAHQAVNAASFQPMNRTYVVSVEDLECSVRVRQWDEGEDDFRTNYTIESVLAHNPKDSGDQLSIE